jgi:hypothetical protein
MKNGNHDTQTPLCGCGCGNSVKKRRNGTFNAFVVGHNTKHSKATKTSKNGSSGLFQQGNRFGQGRPMGSRNGVTLAAESLIQGEGEALSRKLIDLALAGNVACLKTAIERLVPVCKSRPVDLPDLPQIKTIADASTLTSFILDAVAEGKVTPVEGEIIGRSCERHLKALEVRDLEQRLVDLEKKFMDKHS